MAADHKDKKMVHEVEDDDDHLPRQIDLLKEEKLKSTKAEMHEVKEENERLKQMLSKMVKDYQSLQNHCSQILQQENTTKSTKPENQGSSCLLSTHAESEGLVSLSLGRNSSERKIKEDIEKEDNDHDQNRLSLGLDYKIEQDLLDSVKNSSSENTIEEQINKEQNDDQQDLTETWPPSKILKTTKSNENDQVWMKKVRVSVRARSGNATINDGCQWRKYGQKVSKGNPCPRAYYRCTVSPTCPVKKQVQRCLDDMSVLITTYEGNHNHPLPLSATAMASTTSAAAAMLQSTSSTSSQQSSTSLTLPSSFSTPNTLKNFTLSSPSPHQFYFPRSTISTSNTSHPTITLDLTNSTNTNSQFFNKPKQQYYSPHSSSCLSFSSPTPTWTFSDKNHVRSINQQSLGFFNQHQMSFASSNDNQTLNESMEAVTKVIASNPNFRSALAAAINSIASNGENSISTPHRNSTGLNLKLGVTNHNTNINMLSSSSFSSLMRSQEQGSLVLFPPSNSVLPFSGNSKNSGSGSMEHISRSNIK